MKQRKMPALGGVAALLMSGFLLSKAQDTRGTIATEDDSAVVSHPECSFFGAKRDKFNVVGPASAKREDYPRSLLTEQVVRQLSFVPGGSRTHTLEELDKLGPIDKYLFAEMQAAGVTPAAKTSDFEFIRRVTLDLTGRIPAPERVVSFVADTAADKRAQLVDELLNKPEWVDKWTMYFGDLYNNTARNTFVVRYEPARNAFYKWIKDSLTANKSYDKMATELISNQGASTYKNGELNWLVGAWVIGNPQQDNIDQEAANVAETFLGISHMNCVLCHDGRRHLDALSLWGKNMTRIQAWGFSAFLSKTATARVPVAQAVNNQPYYWSVVDDTRITDYALNTTAGNRPVRAPVGTQRTVTPVYPFSGHRPAPGENYRAALAREVTSDFQFARATVNYFWKEFFGRGLVDPVNQFDPDRLDPDNPPPDPWTLQPSNARLLNALAQDFIDSKFDLKALMRELTNSEAYQLSSRYSGEWKPEWEKLFARKLVRRLWAEEIHDAVVQSSGVPVNGGAGYNLTNFSSFPAGSPFEGNPTFGSVQWAMQAPDVIQTPDNGGAVTQFLNAFIRGDRDLEDRRPDGSVLQALNLMNDPFIMSRVSAATAPRNSLFQRNQLLGVDQVTNNFFLAVLSRYPTDAEKKAATAILKTASDGAETLLWSLYNKVDFVFNY